MIVKLCKTDIAKGERTSAKNCPVARAINRTLRRFQKNLNVVVSQSAIDVYAGEGSERRLVIMGLKTPFEVASWITNFDYSRRVEPTTFDIPSLNELGLKRGKKHANRFGE